MSPVRFTPVPAAPRLVRVLAALSTALLVAGCAGGTGGEASASPSPTDTATAVERATAALLPQDRTPAAPPGTLVRPVEPLTAQGSEVSAPWAQFMVCPIVPSRPDEGPATDTEPEALAGAWAFGVAGAAQLDQYAIVYADDDAARAAVSRARAKADDCAALYEDNPDFFGDPPETTLGAVPDGVDGFRVRALFTHDQAASRSEAISTVMRSGDTVHYMRFAPSGYETPSGEEVPSPAGLMDPQWTEQVIAAAAQNLA